MPTTRGPKPAAAAKPQEPPAKLVGRPGANKGHKYPAEPLQPDEVRQLIAACSRRAPTGLRNRALIVTLWRGGLRVAESLALHPKDVDRGTGTLRVLVGKGRKARAVALDPEAMAVVERWFDARDKLHVPRRSPLFCTLVGGPVHPNYVRAMLARKARKAGIDRRVHPHALRHSFATELASEGTPINIVSAALGHANSAVTARYLDHVAPQAVLDTLRARKWC